MSARVPALRDAIAPVSISEAISARLGQWVGIFQDLIGFESLYESEHGIVDYVESHLNQLGISTQRVAYNAQYLSHLAGAQPPYSNMPNRCCLVGTVKGRGRGRSLALNAHLDIVASGNPADWLYPPFAGIIDPLTNIIYGRGAMDNRAGVVIALALAELANDGVLELAGDLVLHLVIEDEVTGNGTLLCLDAGHDADGAIMLDGTRSGKGINAHAGNLCFGIGIRGKPASVSVSHMGVNAVEVLAALLLRLRERVFSLNESRLPPWTCFPSPYQFVTQSLRGDSAALTLPEHAQAICYLTFAPPHDISSIKGLLEAEAQAFAVEQELPHPPVFDWSHFSVEPVSAGANDLESCFQSVAQKKELVDVDFGPSTGTSDLRHYVAAGIQAVLYGPGKGFNPHRANEHYYLDDLGPMITFIGAVAESWCAENR